MSLPTKRPLSKKRSADHLEEISGQVKKSKNDCLSTSLLKKEETENQEPTKSQDVMLTNITFSVPENSDGGILVDATSMILDPISSERRKESILADDEISLKHTTPANVSGDENILKRCLEILPATSCDTVAVPEMTENNQDVNGPALDDKLSPTEVDPNIKHKNDLNVTKNPHDETALTSISSSDDSETPPSEFTSHELHKELVLPISILEKNPSNSNGQSSPIDEKNKANDANDKNISHSNVVIQTQRLDDITDSKIEVREQLTSISVTIEHADKLKDDIRVEGNHVSHDPVLEEVCEIGESHFLTPCKIEFHYQTISDKNGNENSKCNISSENVMENNNQIINRSVLDDNLSPTEVDPNTQHKIDMNAVIVNDSIDHCNTSPSAFTSHDLHEKLDLPISALEENPSNSNEQSSPIDEETKANDPITDIIDKNVAIQTQKLINMFDSQIEGRDQLSSISAKNEYGDDLKDDIGVQNNRVSHDPVLLEVGGIREYHFSAPYNNKPGNLIISHENENKNSSRCNIPIKENNNQIIVEESGIIPKVSTDSKNEVKEEPAASADATDGDSLKASIINTSETGVQECNSLAVTENIPLVVTSQEEKEKCPKIQGPSVIDIVKDFHDKISCNESGWKTDQEVVFEVVDKYSSEYRRIEEKFKKTLDVKLIEVKKIKNLFLWGLFQLKKAECENRKPNQYFIEELFHATSRPAALAIAKDNFDWNKVTRAKFGCGTSFSRSADYANTYCNRDSGRDRAMLIVDVIMNKTVTKSHYPTEECDTSGSGDDKVLVKFADNEFYPKYMVLYKSPPIPFRGLY